jgi:TRAP-type C4-dicarboxylate transport system permease small subunit
MKNVSKHIIAKSMLFILFILVQAQGWAQDASTSTTASKFSEAMQQPGFWIGVVLFIGFILAFILTGREKKEPQLQ